MKNFIKSINSSVSTFIKDEEGSQVVEYALIIAVVSIGLVAVLGDTANGISSKFATLVNRVSDCFTVGKTCS